MKDIRFIVMANNGSGDFFVKDLIRVNLLPEMIVCEDPFFTQGKSVRKVIKKIYVYLVLLLGRKDFKKKFSIFFLANNYSIKTWPSQNVNSLLFVRELKKAQIDYAFVFTFKILSEKVFNIPKYGTINFHPSLLPDYRGANPCNWVVLNKERKTGITFHYIDKGIDTGSIIEQHEIPLSGYEDSKILETYLYYLGSKLFIKLILRIKHEQKLPYKNKTSSTGSYNPPFKREHSIINDKLNFDQIQQTIKAYAGGALFKIGEKIFTIIDVIEVESEDFINMNYPFRKENNIYIKSSDNKILSMRVHRKHNNK